MPKRALSYVHTNISSNTDESELELINKIFFHWKCLNDVLKRYNSSSRKTNIPEELSEGVVRFVNGYGRTDHTTSADAVAEDGTLIQIKATSNFDTDLTSFGPRSVFDELHFVRLDYEANKMFLYNIPVESLKEVKLNKYETFEDQAKRGVRPRLSIIKKFINEYELTPYAIFDFEQCRLLSTEEFSVESY